MKLFHVYLVFVVLLIFFSDCNGQEPDEIEIPDGPKAPKKGLKRLLRSVTEKVPKGVKAAKGAKSAKTGKLVESPFLTDNNPKPSPTTDVPIVADQIKAADNSQPTAASSQDSPKSSTPNAQDVIPPPSNPAPRNNQPDVNGQNGQNGQQITSQSEPTNNPPLGTSNPAQPESSNPGNPGDNPGTPASGDAGALPTAQNEAKTPQAVSTKLPEDTAGGAKEIPDFSIQPGPKNSNISVIVVAVSLVGLVGILGGAFLFNRRRKRAQIIGIEAADAKIDAIVHPESDFVSKSIKHQPDEFGTLPRRQDTVSNPVRDLQNLLELTHEAMRPRYPDQTAINIGEPRAVGEDR
ncbi:hypothetical protein BKA69DRAFT_1101479 [Paraphysoderma sedebokerense]|nr:hypothetical protein BKA69DRAFT_1101479 [Paraphysoderma sedebokerense]